MRNYYLAVAGTMGSGKTTAARLLSRVLGFDLVEENFGENEFLSRFYADMKKWAFHSQTFFLMEKTRQLLDAAEIRKTKKPGKKSIGGIIQDTPIQQDVYSYAKAQHVLGNIDDSEWKLYQKIYKSFEPYFPKPDLIIFLDTSIKEIKNRISKRGRGYEKSIPESYLELLDMLNRKWMADNKSIPVLNIPTDGLNIVNSSRARDALVDTVKKRLNINI